MGVANPASRAVIAIARRRTSERDVIRISVSAAAREMKAFVATAAAA
jgi:hypothetical protein